MFLQDQLCLCVKGRFKLDDLLFVVISANITSINLIIFPTVNYVYYATCGYEHEYIPMA